MTKYPRTPHLPWSPGSTNDDKLLANDDHFQGMIVTITEKMDGENTTMYHDHIHARSVDSRNHPSRNWIKAFHASIKYKIPKNVRICGESLYAKHSIHYTDLDAYFLAFNAWNNDTGYSCRQDVFVDLCERLEISVVPLLYSGKYDSEIAETFFNIVVDNGGEGIVVQNYDPFHIDNFDMNVAKAVRANHVQTDDHWMHSEMIVNGLYSDPK